MTELKPYRKDKEGKLQRLPVEHIQYDNDSAQNLAVWGRATEKTNEHMLHLETHHDTMLRGTFVYTHGSEIKREKLDPTCGVKRARMVTNPFLAAMRKKYEEENAAKND